MYSFTYELITWSHLYHKMIFQIKLEAFLFKVGYSCIYFFYSFKTFFNFQFVFDIIIRIVNDNLTQKLSYVLITINIGNAQNYL